MTGSTRSHQLKGKRSRPGADIGNGLRLVPKRHKLSRHQATSQVRCGYKQHKRRIMSITVNIFNVLRMPVLATLPMESRSNQLLVDAEEQELVLVVRKLPKTVRKKLLEFSMDLVKIYKWNSNSVELQC
jgi:hypothetical protein